MMQFVYYYDLTVSFDPSVFLQPFVKHLHRPFKLIRADAIADTHFI